jgi:hypothetical protein
LKFILLSLLLATTAGADEALYTQFNDSLTEAYKVHKERQKERGQLVVAMNSVKHPILPPLSEKVAKRIVETRNNTQENISFMGTFGMLLILLFTLMPKRKPKARKRLFAMARRARPLREQMTALQNTKGHHEKLYKTYQKELSKRS